MAASTPGHPPLVLHDVIAPDRIGARRSRQGLVVTATTSPRTATRDDGLSSLAKLRREAKSRRPSARCDMKAKAGPPNRAATRSSVNYVAPAWKASRNGKRSWNSAFSAHLALPLTGRTANVTLTHGRHWQAGATQATGLRRIDDRAVPNALAEHTSNDAALPMPYRTRPGN